MRGIGFCGVVGFDFVVSWKMGINMIMGLWRTACVQAINNYPQFINGVLVLGQVENGDEQFWKYKFYTANGKAQHGTQDGSFFFLSERGFLREFFWGVFPLFPMCSQLVLIKFPWGFPSCSLRVFPIAPQFYPIRFCPKFNCQCI